MPGRRMNYGQRFNTHLPARIEPGIDGPGITKKALADTRRKNEAKAERHAAGTPSKSDIAHRVSTSRMNRKVPITLAGPRFDD